MTTAEVTEFTSAASPLAVPARSRFGEFLLAGGASFVLLPLAWLAQRIFGLDRAELAVGFLTFHAAHVVNDPHFTVTYLLFYRDVRQRALGPAFAGAQRARYVVAGFVVPVVVLGWAGAAVALRSAPALGWLFQFMFLLVGWHYAKQGFGVLVVLAERRGFRFDALERRVLLAHCYAAWAYAWASPADPGTERELRGVVYTSVAHGALLERVTLAIFGLSAAVLLGVFARRRLRKGALPPLAPLATFIATIWLWTVFTHLDPLMVYVIPALHSLQYLYLVGLLEGNEARAMPASPFARRGAGARLLMIAAAAVALGFAMFHVVPELLDAAFFAAKHRRVAFTDFGVTPCFAAAYACVNVHHYFMDAVIWRRENPRTKYLRSFRGPALQREPP